MVIDEEDIFSLYLLILAEPVFTGGKTEDGLVNVVIGQFVDQRRQALTHVAEQIKADQHRTVLHGDDHRLIFCRVIDKMLHKG